MTEKTQVGIFSIVYLDQSMHNTINAFLFLIWHHLRSVDKTLKHSPGLCPGHSPACAHVARLSACPAQTDSGLWCIPGPSQVLSVLSECSSHSHIYLVCLFGEKSRLDKFLTPNSHGVTTIFIQMTKAYKAKNFASYLLLGKRLARREILKFLNGAASSIIGSNLFFKSSSLVSVCVSTGIGIIVYWSGDPAYKY